MSHTCAPWSFDDVWHLVKGPNGEEIAAIHAAQRDGASRRENRNTVLSNAHLIAAAPELYESLAKLLEVCVEAGRTDQAMIQASLAINKAKGFK